MQTLTRLAALCFVLPLALAPACFALAAADNPPAAAATPAIAVPTATAATGTAAMRLNPERARLQEAIRQAKTRLDSLTESGMADEHPAVIAYKNRIAMLEATLAKTPEMIPESTPTATTVTPTGRPIRTMSGVPIIGDIPTGTSGPMTRPVGEPTASGGTPLSSRPARFALTATTTDVAEAQFEAVIYAVEVPAERIADLDARALETKAASAKDFDKALAGIGKAKLLYKISQAVNLYGDSINVGSRVPFVTSSRMGANGVVSNTIQYQAVGVIVNLKATVPAKEPASTPPVVLMQVELSAVTESAIEISPGVKAIVISNGSFTRSGPVHYGRPLVALSLADASAGEKEKQPPIAYVIRYVFSEIKP